MTGQTITTPKQDSGTICFFDFDCEQFRMIKESIDSRLLSHFIIPEQLRALEAIQTTCVNNQLIARHTNWEKMNILDDFGRSIGISQHSSMYWNRKKY